MTTRNALCLGLAASALLCLPAAVGQTPAATPAPADLTPRFPNSEDLRHLKAISAPLLSPGGKQVLFTLTDSTADGARSHLWLASVAGLPPRQLTYSPAADKRGEHSAAWAPDSSAIFFLAKRGEQTQLFRLPMEGGEAFALPLKAVPQVDDSKEKFVIPPAPPLVMKTDSTPPEALPLQPSGFALSPDGKTVAFWAADPETAGEKKNKEAKADATWVNHERHGSRLYLAHFKADGTLDTDLKLVKLDPDVQSASWSPKGDRLLVVTEPPNDVSDLGPASAAWLVDVKALDAPKAVKAIPPTVRGNFGWSPDGTEVFYAAQTPLDAPPGVEELYSTSLPDSTAPAPTPAEDQSSRQRLLPGFNGALGYSEPISLKNGRVLVPVAEGTRVTALEVGLDGKTPPISLSQETPIVTSLGTNKAQTGFTWIAESSTRPSTLCYSEALGGNCIPLPVPELAPQLFRSVHSQVIHWTSPTLPKGLAESVPQGQEIEGILYLPPHVEAGSSSGSKVPLIVDVHGGPLGAWEDRYEEWTGFLVGHGWAVLRPNPRGSSSYGPAFAAANKNDLGGGDFEDIMAGVDHVLKNYPIDAGKLALMGYSYGGEMAGFAEGKTDRFQAIISGAPVIDQFSEYGTEKGSWYDRWYFGKPWEHVEDAWKQSPLAGAAKARTPFLLLQGESDSTDPLGQAQEMYRALRQANVPVELVTYPREDHGPLAYGIFGHPVPEPWHGFDARQHIVQFLQTAFKQPKDGN